MRFRHGFLAIVSVCLVSSLAGTAHGQCTNYANYQHEIGTIAAAPSPTIYDLEVQGTYAFQTSGFDNSHLIIHDLTNPGQPLKVCDLPVSGSCLDLSVSGNLLAMAMTYQATHGLKLYDVTDPSVPVLVGTAGAGARWDRVLIIGDYLYVAAERTTPTLRVFDISDPTTPTQVGSMGFAGQPKALAGSGDLLIIANHNAGLLVVDVSDPTTPAILDSYPSMSYTFDVRIDGSTVYASNYGGGLQILDIADPTDIKLLGQLNLGLYLDSYVVYHDGYCYLGSDGGIVDVIDVSNPYAPHKIGRLQTATNSPVYEIALDGSHLFVCHYNGIVTIYSVSSPTPLTPIGQLDTAGEARSVVLAAGRADVAYVADGAGGVQVVDVTNPLAPILLHTVPTPGFANDIAVNGTTAYVAAGAAGLQVIDVSDPFGPSTPPIVGSAATADLALDVAVVDTLAFVADAAGGLRILSVRHADDPFEVGHNDTLSLAQGIEVSGQYAFVADGPNGIRVLDVSDPENPWLIGGIKSRSWTDATAVEVSGSRAYVADADSGLFVLDVSNPASPVLLGSVGTNDQAVGVALAGTYAYVADSASGMKLVDIQDPAKLVQVGNVDVPAVTHDMFVTGDYAYVAAGTAGLQVCPSQCGYTEAVMADFTLNIAETFYPALISFTNHSSGYAASYAWDFGDGAGTSALINPSYYYDEPGVYTVTLTVTGSGNTDVISHDVTLLAREPRISAVTDVPQDQGGFAYVSFNRSGYDDTQPNRSEMYTIERQDAIGWVTVATSGAYGSDTYNVLVQTQGDGAAAWTTPFRVIAHMNEGIWIGPAVSGFSEDNIVPDAPGNVAWNGGTLLSWDPIAAPDLESYRIYGGPTSAFVDAALLFTTVATEIDVAGTGAGWFFVVAIDDAGLTSSPSSPLVLTGVQDHVRAVQLAAAVPNPFNPSTTIAFGLPRAVHARLGVYDVTGRLVRVLVDGATAAGRHEVVWRGLDDRGRSVPSGLYFCRLEAAGVVQTRRMTLLK